MRQANALDLSNERLQQAAHNVAAANGMTASQRCEAAKSDQEGLIEKMGAHR